MKCTTISLPCLFAALSILLLCSCGNKDTQTEVPEATTEESISKVAADASSTVEPVQLPVRYQNPEFVTSDDLVDEEFEAAGDYEIKVGANIRSTRGPQPLWDILKRLAGMKGMSVSWASDVDQNVLVDVDIRATDNYFEAIDNLLRQVDYFHEVDGKTIIIKYKETKTYHVAMPFTQQVYETATGGNILGSQGESSSLEGTIRLDSRGNKFDIWANIQSNLDAIIATWSTAPSASDAEGTSAAENGKKAEGGKKAGEGSSTQVTRQISAIGNSYTIDKPVGLITVNAPRPLQRKIADYLENIKEQLYKQVTIEAKIIEVQLEDSSTLGIDWNLLLQSLSFGGSMALGKSYNRDTTDTIESSVTSSLEDSFGNTNTDTNTSDNTQAVTTATQDSTPADSNDGTTITTSDTSNTSDTSSSTLTNNSLTSAATTAATTAATILTGGASNIAGGTLALATFNFNDFLHALSEQGNTTILANPKLSVLNGQPALITVGRNVTYIAEVTKDEATAESSATVAVTTERVLSGVGMSIIPIIKGDDEIIMTLVPVTTVLEEPIEYKVTISGEIGLPVIAVREMSSMVQVKDGEMLVIGGLISTVESTKGENLFPGLANVPILKYLTGFETKIKQKRELIILLRPRIL
jgi:general secretion pathway protein D/MSHA biogenesis protein MshL